MLNTTNVKNDLSRSDCLVNKIGDDFILDELITRPGMFCALRRPCSRLVSRAYGVGPRALGHRSILGDPRRSDMKDIPDLKIKRRESFRPLHPLFYKNTLHNGLSLIVHTI